MYYYYLFYYTYYTYLVASCYILKRLYLSTLPQRNAKGIFASPLLLRAQQMVRCFGGVSEATHFAGGLFASKWLLEQAMHYNKCLVGVGRVDKLRQPTLIDTTVPYVGIGVALHLRSSTQFVHCHGHNEQAMRVENSVPPDDKISYS